MTIEEKYNDLTTKYLLRRRTLMQDADYGRITWGDSDRLEKEIDNRHMASLMVLFSRATWEDQITLAACSGNEKLIARLDEVQKSALTIIT